MDVSGLRGSNSMLGLRGQGVALKYENLIEVVGEDTRSR